MVVELLNFTLYWLFDRDPYDGFLYSLYTQNNQGVFFQVLDYFWRAGGKHVFFREFGSFSLIKKTLFKH